MLRLQGARFKLSVLFVFVDGLGLGQPGPGNPLFSVKEGPLAQLSGKGQLSDKFRLLVADACLGIPGLPQSATGGTSLFTGVNAPAHIGAHAQGYPNSELKRVIACQGLLRKARERGTRVDFANAYTPPYFERRRTRHRSVTTVTAETAGIRLKRLEDLRIGGAIYRDFSNKILREREYDVEILAPEEAGARLGQISKDNDLLVYEYFQTDIVGHRGTVGDALKLISELNRFLCAALEVLDPDEDGFVLSSDHGNIEDMSISSHTFNNVPILLWGKALRDWPCEKKFYSICDVSPGILSILELR